MDGMLPIRNGIYTDGWLEFTVWTFQPTKSPWTWLFLVIGCVTFGRFFFSKTKTIWTWVWLISSYGLLKVGYEKKPVPTEVPFLLPHEVLNAVYEAGPMQAVVFKTHGSVWALVFYWKHSIPISKLSKTLCFQPCSLQLPWLDTEAQEALLSSGTMLDP